MKKSFFYLPLVAALALTGCSKDDLDVAGENGENNGPVETQYLAINVATTPDGGTRATQGAEADQYGDLYEDGTTQENEVKKVRFYFFNKNGQGVSVDNQTGHSYFDWTPTDAEQSDANAAADCATDDKILKAVVVIETSKAGELPTDVVAVVNPTADAIGTEKPSLLQVQDAYNDYAARANAETPQFTMSNSVYAQNGAEVCTTSISQANFFKDRADALKNPIIIHVERTVAKVRVLSSLTTEDVTVNGTVHKLLQLKSYDATTKTETPIMVDGKAVYLDVEGWNVTRTLNNAWLLKQIDPTWPATFPESTIAWNDPSNFRSYWADICTKNGTPGSVYGDFAHAKAIKLNGKVYATENGEHTDETGAYDYRASEIIIGGTICDETGTALTVCEIAGSRMFGIDALKNAYLGMLENKAHKHYWLNGDKMVEMGVNDIQFLTAADAAAKGLITDFTHGISTGSYKVYPCLTDDAAAKTWYTAANTSAATENAATINSQLLSIGAAKIWNEGKTYYYTEIGHLGKSSGVIRNHIYEMKITGLYGLGTPVYKPEEKIIPEKPSSEEAYVAAQLRILSWRVVQNDVTLDWGK